MRIRVAFLFVGQALLLSAPALVAQGPIGERVRAAGDGMVEFTFDGRAGVCGDGDRAIGLRSGSAYTMRPEDALIVMSDRDGDISMRGRWNDERDCRPGVVSVRLNVEDGDVMGLRTRVGNGSQFIVSPDAAAAYLFDLARSSEDADVAEDALLPAVLADTRPPVDPLRGLALLDARPMDVREAAVFWLSIFDGPASDAALADILASRDASEVHESALFAAAQHRSEDAVTLLRGVAEDVDRSEDIRETAIFWIGQQEVPSNAGYLRSLFQRIASPDLRDQTLFAIAETGTDDSREWLLMLAADERHSLDARRTAIFWAGEMEHTRVADLVAVYDRSDDPELREHILFVLSQRDEETAIRKLAAIALAPGPVELRKKALFWLGQSDHPLAADVLAEILR